MKGVLAWSVVFIMAFAIPPPGISDELNEFRTQEIKFEFDSAVIVGTLYLPSGEGPFPLLVAVHGSGPADRTSFGYFNLLAPLLLDDGIAFFSYDKPGVGDSDGDWLAFTLADRARKSVAAVTSLKSHPEIDEENIGLFGGSQGGWVAPLAATMDKSISHVIVFSGPGISPREQNIFVVENSLRLAGQPESVVSDGKAWATEVMRAAANDVEWEEAVSAYIEPAVNQPWGSVLPLGDERIWDYLRLKDPVTGESDFDHDPIRVLTELKTPILAIFGEEDPLVPVNHSVRLYREGLAASAAKPTQVKVFSGANHVIRIESGTFAHGFVELIIEWTKERGR